VYVKAQIPFGDRASLGLVARADDIAAVGQLAGAQIGQLVDGLPVAAVLVETAADPLQSAYLSVHVDDEAGARVLRVGLGGGAGYRPGDAEVQVALPSRGLETFEVRNLLGAAGVSGPLRESLTRAATALVRAAREWHAYTIEVNPLFVTDAGVLAIDAKIELDDYSLATVPDRSLVPAEVESPRELEARAMQQRDHRGSFRYVQLIDESVTGDRSVVGSHSVGGGESLVVFDALESVGLRPANYCDTSGNPSQEKVAFAAELIAGQPHISGFFFSSCIANQPLSVTAAGLVEGFRAAGWRGPTVVRIAGNEEDEARAIVEEWGAAEGVPATVLGREVDEWDAARALADLLREGGA